LRQGYRVKIHEIGAVKKRWKDRIAVALVFPDTYGLGMSNLGYQRVYELLNGYDQVVAERFFLPGPPFHGVGLRSIESNRGLSEFDIILFSISFEYSYLNIPIILRQGGLGLFVKDRTDSSSPLVLAGGVACQINPEPIAPFIDAFVLGDFEALCPGFVRFLQDNYPRVEDKKETLLERLVSMCPGVYVPLFCPEQFYGDDRVEPAIEERSPEILPHTVVLSDRAAFSNTFLLEVSRGCGRGCRFCAAGYVYRPPRPWPMTSIRQTLALSKETSKIGLVGLEFMEEKGLCQLVSSLLEDGFQIGFSSLRADAVTDDFARLLAASGSKTATIAAEAGSERLRKTINKHLSENQLLGCCDILLSAGIRNLKLYFMLGLPFEQDEDVEDMIRLSKEILGMLVLVGKERGRLGRLTVSVSTFVPKAWTPFQWAGFVDMETLKYRRKMLEKALRGKANCRLKLDSPDKAMVQAVLSRGDRRLGLDLVPYRLKGMGSKKIVKKISPIAEKYLKERAKDEFFPWEVIKHRVKREFLYSQWKKAERGLETPFCHLEKCRKCGACRGLELIDGPGKP